MLNHMIKRYIILFINIFFLDKNQYSKYMSKKYDMKFDQIIKKILDLYIENKPDKLERYNTTAGFIRYKIKKEVNKALDFLDKERKENKELQKKLNSKEFKDVLEILDSNDRF